MEEKVFFLLSEGIKKLNLSLSPERVLNEKEIQQLSQYIALLHKWNGAYNLTAVRDPEEMVKKHVMDSLSVLPILDKEFAGQGEVSIADIGSGAGLPGIPLAIARPEWSVTLIDSNGKKAGFLNNAKHALGLKNIVVINARAEAIKQTYNNIICRAFASLAEMAEFTKSLWHEQTTLWAMKGKYPDEELRELPKSYRVSASYALDVPGIDAERHLLKIVKQASA